MYNLYLKNAPPGVPIDLSAVFGNAALWSFTFTGGGNGSSAGLSVGSITYNSAVPEPSSLALRGISGAMGLMVARTRRDRA